MMVATAAERVPSPESDIPNILARSFSLSSELRAASMPGDIVAEGATAKAF